jgi:hypothetical protein
MGENNLLVMMLPLLLWSNIAERIRDTGRTDPAGQPASADVKRFQGLRVERALVGDQ